MSLQYQDLRDFINTLEKLGELKRISVTVDPYLEITEICDRVLRQNGPALLFESPKGFNTPVLANLFGTTRRVALGMGAENVDSLRAIGEVLAALKEPEPPKGVRDALHKLPVYKQVLNMGIRQVKRAPCQANVLDGDDIDLNQLPIQTCWPGDAGPLVTWPLVVTRGPHKKTPESRHLSTTSHWP